MSMPSPKFDLVVPLVNGEKAALLRVPLVSCFARGGGRLGEDDLAKNWWLQQDNSGLTDHAPGGAGFWECLTVARDRSELGIYFPSAAKSLDSPETYELLYKYAGKTKSPTTTYKLSDSSFQLPLCIAAWALALTECSERDDGLYLRAAEQFHLTGTLIPGVKTLGIAAKSDFCLSDDPPNTKFARHWFLTIGEGAGLVDKPQSRLVHCRNFADVFSRVFRDCPLNSLEAAKKDFDLWRTDPINLARCRDRLTRWLAGPADFVEVCSKARVPISLQLQDFPPAERWEHALRFAREDGRLSELLSAALPSLRQSGRLESGREDAWTNREYLHDKIAGANDPCEVAPEGEDDDRRLLGLAAVNLVWRASPPCPVVREHLQKNMPTDLNEKARLKERTIGIGLWHRDHKKIADPDLAAALTADYLAGWLANHEADRKRFFDWLVATGGELSGQLREVVVRLFRWWPPAFECVSRWREDRSPSSPHTWDALLAAGAPIDKEADSPAVALAYRDENRAVVADLLERAGETRVDVYLQHFRRQRQEKGWGIEGLVGLARAMRRLIEAGASENSLSQDPDLKLALHAAVSTAQPSDLSEVQRRRKSLRWWLHVIPCNLVDRLLEVLVKTYTEGPESLRRNAGLAIASQMDLLPAWLKLGAHRAKWINELTIKELNQPNFVWLVNRLSQRLSDARREKWEDDWALLLARLELSRT